MISYVKGRLTEIDENTIVIETAGIGYNIQVPGSVLSQLPSMGSEVKIYTYLYIREDAMNLYGFMSRDDLKVFKLLIGVSGIGPKGALAVLSVMTPDDLRFAILAGDAKAISKAPGVGAKTAQRLIIELKDKLSLEDAFRIKSEHTAAVNVPVDSKVKDEAVMALVALGYSQSEAFRAVNMVETADADVEQVIKQALSKLLMF
ncbi:MAG: Holliday junction branch migration protein RuvA [Lachnospiraceae bacterium]|nr:Holliday junction branch migration protein RuvA [Lachnospiraceae bacterium]